MTADPELPIWARDDALPEAGPGWGWVDRKGHRVSVESLDELSRAIVEDAGARVDLVWTPEARGYVLPEEIPALHPALREARVRWAHWEISEGKRQMATFAIALAAVIGYNLLKRGSLLSSGTLGLALLLFFILGFLPWYQGRKRLRRARDWAAGKVTMDLPAMRFETWLSLQAAPVTRLIYWLLAIAGLVQLGVELSAYLARQAIAGVPASAALMKVVWSFGTIDGFGKTVALAGLTKSSGHATEWWRLLTAPFLHGHWIHWVMNTSALAYLGKRVESFARWPHVVMTFAIAMWVGGEASARFTATSSIGASGGLMGLLGFLLVFETLHPRLVPRSSRRRLVAGIVMTAAIGYLFRHFIDNAAHLGGLVAGMVYAAVVFPSSNSVRRPNSTRADLLLGGAAVGLLIACCALACAKMLA